MIDFGLVDAVDSEAIGEPGKRTFRIRARAGSTSAALWLGKEQLTALGRGISQLLAERAPRSSAVPPAATIEAFALNPDVTLVVVRLAIDFMREADRVIVLADDQPGMERGDTPTFRMELSRRDALGLVRTITQVVAAGRPRCPLCAQPLEGEGHHFCPGSDGHTFEIPIPSRDEGQDGRPDAGQE